MRATCPAQLILLNFLTLIILSLAPICVVFSDFHRVYTFPMSFPVSDVHI
jgi:hypothetical protein